MISPDPPHNEKYEKTILNMIEIVIGKKKKKNLIDADCKIKCRLRINYGPLRKNYGPLRINYGPLRLNYVNKSMLKSGISDMIPEKKTFYWLKTRPLSILFSSFFLNV